MKSFGFHKRFHRERESWRHNWHAAYAELGLFIGGEWLGAEGRKTSPVVNPATEEMIGHLPHASKADLDRALAEAERGFKLWRAIFPDARGKVLKRAADLMRERAEEIARIATTESGKSIHETRVEVQMSANIFEWFAEEGRRAYGRVLPQRAPGTRLAVVKEPVGPVAAFAPWNFPIGNPARKIGAALGAGCSCILKPAEETPASGARRGAMPGGCGAARGRAVHRVWRAGGNFRHTCWRRPSFARFRSPARSRWASN